MSFLKTLQPIVSPVLPVDVLYVDTVGTNVYILEIVDIYTLKETVSILSSVPITLPDSSNTGYLPVTLKFIGIKSTSKGTFVIVNVDLYFLTPSMVSDVKLPKFLSKVPLV